MLITGNEDLRVRRTIEAIKRSFEEMICEMDYEKIRVTELCQRAMINKKTFCPETYSLNPCIFKIDGLASCE